MWDCARTDHVTVAPRHTLPHQHSVLKQIKPSTSDSAALGRWKLLTGRLTKCNKYVRSALATASCGRLFIVMLTAAARSHFK
jgi:hypothetical protein